MEGGAKRSSEQLVARSKRRGGGGGRQKQATHRGKLRRSSRAGKRQPSHGDELAGIRGAKSAHRSNSLRAVGIVKHGAAQHAHSNGRRRTGCSTGAGPPAAEHAHDGDKPVPDARHTAAKQAAAGGAERHAVVLVAARRLDHRPVRRALRGGRHGAERERRGRAARARQARRQGRRRRRVHGDAPADVLHGRLRAVDGVLRAGAAAAVPVARAQRLPAAEPPVLRAGRRAGAGAVRRHRQRAGAAAAGRVPRRLGVHLTTRGQRRIFYLRRARAQRVAPPEPLTARAYAL
ncbi:DNA-binding protein HU / low-complexity AKP-rich domain [Gracilaria domingensis]|nr:DNA-binding protein HU / low-complexity AKP-rich domain [Gracilaria domingensis]